MTLFFNQNIVIFITLFFLINSKDNIINVDVWERNQKNYNLKISNINSYIFDSVTGAELFLYNNTNNLYLKHNSGENEIPNIFNIKELQSPLINVNTSYYFCGSLENSQALMMFINNEIKIIKNFTLDNNKRLKCLRAYNSIALAIIGGKNIYFWDYSVQYYNITTDCPVNGKIIGFSFYDFENQDEKVYRYSAFLEVSPNNYTGLIYKKVNEGITPHYETNVTNLKLYENIEISAKQIKNIILYIFSYDNSNKCNIYSLDLSNTKTFLDITYYFRFFNDFRIDYIKFIEETLLVFYKIEIFTNDKTKYIGIADLQSFIVVYNIEENVDTNLYFNNYMHKLLYFKENNMITFCPFVEENSTCLYTSFIDINQKKDNLYENNKTSECSPNKVETDKYCIYNCSMGYENKEGKCDSCDIFVGKYVSFKSHECVETNACKYNVSNGICYDCANGNDKKTIYFKDKCIENCAEVFGVKDETNICKICGDEEQYYSFALDQCIDKINCTNGEINTNYYYCRECYADKKVYYEFNNTCLDNCNFFQFVNISGSCKLCTDIEQIYQNGECKNDCDIIGYGRFPITYNESGEDIHSEYCTYCKNISNLYFQKNGSCSEGCGSGYIINDTINNICTSCENDKKYYFDKEEVCIDQCPKGSRELSNHICSLCDTNDFYYEKGNDFGCRSECDYEIKKKSITINNKELHYNECIFCGENEIVVNHTCRGCLNESDYLYKNKTCYKCFCGGNPPFSCYEGTNRCNCLDSHNYFGHNCEFYTEIDIKTKNLTIISLNNRLIKTSENYFSFHLINFTKLPDNHTFSWKFYLNGDEITNETNYKNYKDIFITSPKERIFGINKRLFEDENNRFYLELYIMDNENIYLQDNISFIIIKPFEYENYCEKSQSTSLALTEKLGYFVLENRKKKEGIFYGKYFFQYGLIDENNEKIPLTDYIDEESNNISVICSKGYYINMKNDREEIIESIKNISSCTHYKFKDIKLNSNDNFTKAEKLFLLISNFKYNDQYEIKNANISDINDFLINDIIPNVINKNGSYQELSTNGGNRYFEPKLLFSFIYNYENFMKPNLNEGNASVFFDYFGRIFEEVFNKLSSNTLSISDIKSLFRTIDNLYDIYIEKNFIQFYDKFIDILDNIAKYLSYRSFPSQTFHLIGKRISLLLYNLGKYEKSISFPFLYNSFDANTKDLSSYTFNNYYFNEQAECKQEERAFFCIDKINYQNLKNKLYNKNENITDAFISFYLLSEINPKNEKNKTHERIIYDDEDIEKITVNQNYSTVIKIFKNVSGVIDEIKGDKDLYIKADFEFPYRLNLDKENTEKKNEMNITLYPDNKDFACITKSFYKNPENLKEDEKYNKYTCFTHFDYENKIVRCSCNFTSGEEIMVIKNSSFSEEIKRIQFQKTIFNLTYKYILYIIYLFIFLLLIPSIYYLLSDILKDSKNIRDKTVIKTIEDERKAKYNEVKKFYNLGALRFSFYLLLKKYPFFAVFNNYIDYPKFIKHLIIALGLYIGFIVPIIPYLFVIFSERETFINQRDINFPDSYIQKISSDKYIKLSIYFSVLGFIAGNLFIYIFGKILSYEKKELDIWIKIKTICKDYIYYEVKSEVLLGAVWKKIQLRMLSYYYICGDYILKKKKNKEKNYKAKEYLKYTSRNYDDKASQPDSFNDIGGILPRISTGSNILNISKDINSINNDEKSFEMAKRIQNQPLLDKEDDILLNNNKAHKKNERIHNNIMNISGTDSNYIICKMDNFKIDSNPKNDKSRTIERYEKVRNKYIYVHKKNYGNEIEIDDKSIDEKDNYNISQQINYFYLPNNSFSYIKNKRDNSTNIISKFIYVSLLLIILSIFLVISSMYLIKTVLNKFDEFILKAWIRPILILLTIVNLLLYYIKMLIGSLLLYNCYHLRKKGVFIKCLFWLFVDKEMIQMYKIKNLITKYKKEFDYL